MTKTVSKSSKIWIIYADFIAEFSLANLPFVNKPYNDKSENCLDWAPTLV